MLKITHLSGSAATVAGYVDHVHRETAHGTPVGYYDDAAVSRSSWHGRGAERVGLTGAVEREALERVLSADDFDRRRHSGAQRLGTDITFSAPKSVSLVGLAGGDSRVLRAHDEAVRAALDYIEREVVTTRTGAGGVHREHTGNLIAAVYRHEDARPIDGIADPQLHSHSVVANLTQRETGQWRTVDLDFGPENERMHMADAVYKSTLAAQLREYGYQIVQSENGFEIAGISEEQRESFSRRSAAIESALQRLGLDRDSANAHARDRLNVSSREGKKQLPQSVQRAEWAERAQAVGIDFHEIQAIGDAAFYDARPLADRQREALRYAVDHLSERADVYSRDALARTMIEGRYGELTHTEAYAAIDGSDALVALEPGRYTSVAAAEREGWIIGRMQAGRGQSAALVNDEAGASAHIRALEADAGHTYSHGQREALGMMLTSRDQVLGIRGAAGAGKTTALAPAVASAQARGYEVIGLGPSARAAEELAGAGADETRTLASYVQAQARHGADEERPRMVVLDEAGMVSSRDMQALMATLRTQDRLVLVGDQRQIQAVEAGSPFDALQREGMATAEIGEIRRQQDPEQRRVAALFADGQAEAGAEAAKQYMQEVAVPQRREGEGQRAYAARKQAALGDAAADRWLALRADERDRTMVLSGTNAVRERINERVRAGLREEGAIATQGTDVAALRKVDMTRAQRRHAGSYAPANSRAIRPGDALVIEHDGHRYDLLDVDRPANTLRVSERGGGEAIRLDASQLADARVYRVERMELAAGDQVTFRANDREAGVRNGDTGRVLAADQEGVQVQIAGRTDTVTLDREAGTPLEYGYARTIHAAQGATVDRALVAGEGGRSATANTAYVAMSRQRHAVEVVTDDAGRLATGWSRAAQRQGPSERQQPGAVPERIRAARGRGIERAHTDAARGSSQDAEISADPLGTESSRAPSRRRSRDQGMEL
ncbi:MobF family relaxase [Arhodomonas sp. SL1]|uniref:MobF family relaxase n=1 Tax=Arhodomonas sp. SL1 TaxID=3425691 RepID=UPI003F88463F